MIETNNLHIAKLKIGELRPLVNDLEDFAPLTDDEIKKIIKNSFAESISDEFLKYLYVIYRIDGHQSFFKEIRKIQEERMND